MRSAIAFFLTDRITNLPDEAEPASTAFMFQMLAKWIGTELFLS